MIACLIICASIVLIILIRQRRLRKFGGRSPVYSGFKMLTPGSAAALTLKENMQMTVVTADSLGNGTSLHANGTISTRTPSSLNSTGTFGQGRLIQSPDGNLYVTDGTAESCSKDSGIVLGQNELTSRPLPSLPSWNGFHFPPPPPPEYTG